MTPLEPDQTPARPEQNGAGARGAPENESDTTKPSHARTPIAEPGSEPVTGEQSTSSAPVQASVRAADRDEPGPTATEEVLDKLAKRVDVLCERTTQGFDRLGALVAEVRNEDIAGVKKQLSFIPPKMRSVEDKVMFLRDSISESKYRDLLKDLLRIYDLIDQVLAGLVVTPGCTVMEQQSRNYEVLKTQIRQILAVHGLTEIDTSGPFDPELHQAMGKVETDDPELDGRIARVRRPGFKTENAVLRYAECDIYSLVPQEAPSCSTGGPTR